MKEATWKTPVPLEFNIETSAPPYPVDALPDDIKKPVLSYQGYGQQPTALIACTALANVSLACQALANVARDKLLISPVSLFFITAAQSGERKTMIDKSFSQGIREWQEKTRDRLMPSVITAMAAHSAWKAERDGILKQIKQVENPDLIKGLQAHFTELSLHEPLIPLLPELFFEDITQEALIHSLSKEWPSSSLWSDEGGLVLSGGGMQTNAIKFITTLNRLWDGNAFKTHRKTSKNIFVHHRRFTLSLMIQPFLLEHLLKKQDSVARQSGFLARVLVTQPVSSMGNRYYQDPPTTLTELDKFHKKIMGCLDTTLDLDHRGCHNIPKLQFSTSAKKKWISFFNSIESGINKLNQWQSIQDVASKSAENVARLAALFHLFLGKTGDIKAESIEQASEIIYWHLLEAKRIFSPIEPHEKYQEAQKMLVWLKTRNVTETSSRQLQQYGNFRDKTKREASINTLIDHHYLIETIKNGRKILLVNPS